MPIENSPAGPDRQQLEIAYREAQTSEDIRVTRLGLEILWKKVDETLAELDKAKK
jgi:hypothetical protein